MLRTHTCGELRISNVGEKVTLCGWVHRIRDKGSVVWIDIRDRYGLTQLLIEEKTTSQSLINTVRTLGREYVIQAGGTVVERFSKNDKLPTGEIEIKLESLKVLNPSKLPPFLIDDDTDGGEDLRMKFRYLDLRRPLLRENLILRYQITKATREYLDAQGFIEIETPVLIKSTPEGARDFVVPSRVNPGQFYALPQSPQTFKQLLMVSGFDRYYQIVKCFRDEDLRSDRQPEFTQIDCEMSFVEQQDVLQTFEGLIKYLFKKIKNIEISEVPRMTYENAIKLYGTDKPDIRFGMEFVELTHLVKGKGFGVFEQAELVIGICAKGMGYYTRKQIDELTDWVKRPQIGAKGLVHVKFDEEGKLKSSVDKFFSEADLLAWVSALKAEKGDLILILAGDTASTRKQMAELRLEVANRLGLRKKDTYSVHWVVDFPLLEWDSEEKRWVAMHHPFTSPQPQDIPLLESNPEKVKANAYDLVINGVEVGGGSIRIHDPTLQAKIFEVLGFSKQEAKEKFGFLMEAFEYGAPPHGGLAFGLDRLCALMGGADSIRDFIAFPKNNSGRDVMIDAPSEISESQLEELSIEVRKKLYNQKV